MAQIQLEQLSKTYGRKPALDGLDLDIQGGMIGLLGPNGAGKTTLIRILTGFLQPSAGHARIAGFDVTKPREKVALRQQLGYVPQHPQFYPTFSCIEMLDFIAQLKGIQEISQRRHAIEKSLAYVGLSDHAEQATRKLSGGMLRRLGIAQAMINDPQVLIVDEPTAGLDPEERMRFRQLLSGLSGERLVLLSTHIVEDIAQTCQQVVILKQRVLYSGPLQQLIQQTDQAGVVWELNQIQPLNDAAIRVVSSMVDANGYHYRIVGQAPHIPSEAKPSRHCGLEESYLWIMQQSSAISVGS